MKNEENRFGIPYKDFPREIASYIIKQIGRCPKCGQENAELVYFKFRKKGHFRWECFGECVPDFETFADWDIRERFYKTKRVK